MTTTAERYLDLDGRRMQDIAGYVTGWLHAYTSEITLDWTDVRDALFTPSEARDDVQRLIVQVEQSREPS